MPLSEHQESLLALVQQTHRKMMLEMGGYAPHAVYFTQEGAQVGQLAVTNKAEDWMKVVTYPIVTVDAIAAVLISNTATAVDETGAQEVLVVTFTTANGFTVVPVPYDLVGDEVVYGTPDREVASMEGSLSDELASSWERHGGAWREGTLAHLHLPPTMQWPQDLDSQWRAATGALEMMGVALCQSF